MSRFKDTDSPVELSNKTVDWFNTMDNRRISIVIPTYNRYELTIDSFRKVLFDYRVENVYITDDASTDDSYEKLTNYFRFSPKIKLFRNETNLDCYFNKHKAAENAKDAEWIVILDSDNQIDESYLDAIFAVKEWDKDTIYAPQALRPAFDFTKWAGLTLTKENVAQYANTDLMTSCNAFNFFINRENYLKVWDGSVNPLSSDSIYFTYCWLLSGKKYYICPNLEYFHRLHEDKSNHFSQNQHKTVRFHENLMNKIRQLK